jgi:hypothetical protein
MAAKRPEDLLLLDCKPESRSSRSLRSLQDDRGSLRSLQDDRGSLRSLQDDRGSLRDDGL